MHALTAPGVDRFDLAAKLLSWAELGKNPLGGIFRGLLPGNSRLIVKDADHNPQFERQGLPRLSEIPISAQLLHGHPLAEFISKSSQLSSHDLRAILHSPSY